MKNKTHSFHIPVMGTGFTIDTPIKVAKYGISSVISLVDDTLIELMRKHYCSLRGEKYVPIEKDDHDSRARRITAYLDLVDGIVQKDFQALKTSPFEPGTEITKYFEMLPDYSELKKSYLDMLGENDAQTKKEKQDHLRSRISPGDINVNIMTKLDRVNYDRNKKELPTEFTDAMAALRGFARSKLNSAVVLSAGFNRKLYGYLEKFDDFYENASGFFKKKIILKVKDFRSTLIQGKFLAKRGLWVSEYRFESGLNCGGHTFAVNGSLLGPILEEIKAKRQQFINNIVKIYHQALDSKKREFSETTPAVAITVQGGIGTAGENNFLRSHYDLDGTGWASPFLLTPEVTNVDDPTLQKLAAAQEDELYLSDVSPLQIPFNNLHNSTSESEKERRIAQGIPGSPCPRGHLVNNTEFTETPICTASRQYQKMKLEQLRQQQLDEETYQKEFRQITEKSCICHDLGGGAIIKNSLGDESPLPPSAVCPGPNLAYFSKIATLSEMVGYIYGRLNLLNGKCRPHMFIKELRMSVDCFLKEIKKCPLKPTVSHAQALIEFKNNLLNGIEYYKKLFPQMVEETQEFRQRALDELQLLRTKLERIIAENNHIFSMPVPSLAVTETA